MRLANEIAAAAMEHMRGVLRARHDVRAGRRGLAGLRARRGHRLEGQGRPRAAVLADLVGAVDPHVHGDLGGAGAGGRADALRDLGVRRRLLGRPHEEPRLRRAEAALPRARAGPAGGLRRGRRLGPAGRQLRRRSTAACARASTPSASRASRRTRSCTASARARTSRPTPTRRSRPRSSRAWCSPSSPAATGPRAAACASRTTSSSPRPGREKLSPFPDGIVNV